MGLRSTLSSLLSAPATRLLERDLRELVDDVLASRPLVHAEELQQLREQLKRGGSAGDDARIAELQAEVASLRKKLSMATGAVQASTAQLMAVKQTAEEALAAARQAGQRATSGKATAEAAIDGVTGLEERLAALVEQLGTAGSPASPPLAADQPDAAGPVATADDGCKVPGCGGVHRARGFCARHYQQYRRSTLEGFVGPDGVVPLPDGTFQVPKRLAAQPAAPGTDGKLIVAGKPVAAKPVTG